MTHLWNSLPSRRRLKILEQPSVKLKFEVRFVRRHSYRICGDTWIMLPMFCLVTISIVVVNALMLWLTWTCRNPNKLGHKPINQKHFSNVGHVSGHPPAPQPLTPGAASISRHINPLVDSPPGPAWAHPLYDQHHLCGQNRVCALVTGTAGIVNWLVPVLSPGCSAADQAREAWLCQWLIKKSPRWDGTCAFSACLITDLMSA